MKNKTSKNNRKVVAKKDDQKEVFDLFDARTTASEETPKEENKGINLETKTLPKKSKWRLFFWRVRRLFTKFETTDIEIVDTESMLKACHKHNMTLDEYISHVLEWHLKYGYFKDLKEETKKIKNNKTEDKILDL